MTKPNYSPAIAAALAQLCASERASELLGYCVGRILLRRGKDWVVEYNERADDIRHVADWIEASCLDEDEWLGNLDGHGRPKKLMKFGSIDEMAKEADKAVRKRNQKFGNLDLEAGHEEEYLSVSDGFRFVRMLSEKALDRESALMQHCIGHGSYDDALVSGDYLFLSLRDQAGNPHATLEIDVKAGNIIQLQGKQNREPVERYHQAIRDLISVKGFGLYNSIELLRMVRDDAGDWHLLDELPDSFRTSDSLRLGRVTRPFRMPSELEVGGDLALPDWIEGFPRVLKVGGDLHVEGDIHELPPEFSVGGKFVIDAERYKGGKLPGRIDVRNLVLAGMRMKALPSDFHVTGDLSLGGAPGALKFDRLFAGGTHEIGSAQAAVKFDRLFVGGTLEIAGKSIKRLLGDIDVSSLVVEHGDLVIADTITIRGDLCVNSSTLTLPRKLRVGGNMAVTSDDVGKHVRLPDDLVVKGSLDLSTSLLDRLPPKLRVGGDLILTDSKFTDLTGLEKVGGRLDIAGTRIVSIPPSIKRIGGIMASCSDLAALPDDLVVDGNLIVIATPLAVLPARLTVGKNLYAQNTFISETRGDTVVRGKTYLTARAPAAVTATATPSPSGYR
jgi:hypothetical protein